MEDNLSGKMVLKKWFEQKQCGCLGGTGTKVKGSHKQFNSPKMIVLLPQKEEHRRRSIRWFHCSNACLTLVNLLCNRSGPKMKHQKEQFCWYCIVCVIYMQPRIRVSQTHPLQLTSCHYETSSSQEIFDINH